MSFLTGAEWAGLSQSAGAAVLSAAWQGILLAAIAALGLRMLPKTPASVRFAVWFGVFGLMVGLPAVGMMRHAGSGAAGHGAWITVDARWCVVLAAVWVGASLVRAVTLVAAGMRVRTLWRRAEAVDFDSVIERREGPGLKPGSSPSLHRGLKAAATPARRAEVCVSDEVDRPAVIGFFAPRILVPRWLMEKLTAEELRQIVVHEAGHLSRADDWMNLLQKIALVIFPLNPALAWVERRLCFERELAVDEEVLRAFGGEAGAAHAYASCLARLAEFRLGRRAMALAIGAMGRESELGRRVKRILARGEAMRPAQARLVMGGAMALLLATAVGLARCPQVVGFGGTPVAVATSVASPVGIDGVREVNMSAAIPPAFERVGDRREVRRVRRSFAVTPHRVTEDRVRPVDVMARDRSHRATSRDERDSAVQWMLLTSWNGSATGSRDVHEDENDAHPYAAVPVRGGWLVFQL